MLFAIVYSWSQGIKTEETRRLRRTFVAWNPPAEAELVAHYHYVRGGSGIVIMQATEASTIFEALAAFVPGIDFRIEPVVNVIEAMAIKMDIEEWADSFASDDTEGEDGE